jgi:hypothetical protein
MKLKCALCLREVEGSADANAPNTIGGGRAYHGMCPEHGAFQDVAMGTQPEAGFRWEGSKAMLICPTCKKEWPAESPIGSQEVGSAYRIFHGQCPADGPLFHRGS